MVLVKPISPLRSSCMAAYPITHLSGAVFLAGNGRCELSRAAVASRKSTELWFAMDELTREFLIESQEGLNRMERCLTELEQHPGGAALIAEIFRSVHTIKGTTGFLGFRRLEKLAHTGENLLALLRDGKIRAETDVITALLQLLDALRCILRTIEAGESEGTGNDAPLIHRLEGLQRPAAGYARPMQEDSKKEMLKGPHSRVPPPSHSSTKAGAEDSGDSSPQQGKVPAPSLHTHSQSTTLTAQAGFKTSSLELEAADSTLRVEISQLNRMMNLVAELVLTRNQILQATAAIPGLTSLSRRLDRITADLRESVFKARMQPVSHVFDKIPRMVRDLSQSLGRRVHLEIEGQETELDKSLLEALKHPLTHAVRNAIDHGIEPPDVRVAAGKAPAGKLKVNAVQKGGHVIIEVSDDGAGIRVELVRERAVERGLILPERAAQYSEQELLRLIFVPGFSTASEVTKVSGRGVGMDVVRTNIERIGGKVELNSSQGKGTTLRLRIPLTMAIISALIVRSAGQSFALPQAALSEIVHIPPQRVASVIEWIEDLPLYRLRGTLLPLVFLDRMLSPGSCHPDEGRERYIAVVDADGRRFGLVADGLWDLEEIVVKPLHPALKAVGIYSGAAVLGSGDLALILDPAAIAIRAGIVFAETGCDPCSKVEAPTKEARYLLVDIGGRRAAVLLDDVVRIEQIPVSKIEYIHARPVLDFNGSLLPVDDTAGLLGAAESGSQMLIVVCRDGERHVGFVVSHLLDIASGSDLVEAGSSQRAEGVMLLNDHLTPVVDVAQVPPLAEQAMDADRAAASAVLP